MNKERELLKAVCNILANAKLAKPEDIEILNAIYIELDKPEETHIVWIPNTGVMPKCKTVLVRFNDGMIDGRLVPKGYDWRLNRDDSIKEYAIIE